jgi:hypothetical protein
LRLCYDLEQAAMALPDALLLRLDALTRAAADFHHELAPPPLVPQLLHRRRAALREALVPAAVELAATLRCAPPRWATGDVADAEAAWNALDDADILLACAAFAPAGAKAAAAEASAVGQFAPGGLVETWHRGGGRAPQRRGGAPVIDADGFQLVGGGGGDNGAGDVDDDDGGDDEGGYGVIGELSDDDADDDNGHAREGTRPAAAAAATAGGRRATVCFRCNLSGHEQKNCPETRLTMELRAIKRAALQAPSCDELCEALRASQLGDGAVEWLRAQRGGIAALSPDDKDCLVAVWRELLSYDAKRSRAGYEEALAAAQALDAAYEARRTAQLLRAARVIGATTTGAAKYGALLRELAPQIIVIEEAAEVLEAHVIAALSPRTQHLILIGDHQQLRPVVQEYDLAQRGNLEVSLFERLVAAGAPHVTLLAQRRMHPHIRALIAPGIIYRTLDDAGAVAAYPPVPGLKHRLAFVTHTERERETGGSRANAHEAVFAARLARHLLLNGVPAEDVVMLAMYQGQVAALRTAVRDTPGAATTGLAGVRVKTVDNFQGEEARVVILSLVRSNPEGNIGFVKEPSRLCVALSRAKHGMYVLGNVDLFRAVSPLWQRVCDRVLERGGSIEPFLQLNCANGHDRERGRAPRLARRGEDFDTLALTGGCTQPCGARRPVCGHACAFSRSRTHARQHTRARARAMKSCHACARARAI